MKEICIIPCGNKKIWSKYPERQAVPAAEAYIGTFHNLCKSYAEKFFNTHLILSAKHGLLRPEDEVDGMYDVSFSMKIPEVITLEELQLQMKQKSLYMYDNYVVLTGKKYVPILGGIIPSSAQLDFPLLDCKGIGYMQRRLKQAIESDTPIHKVIQA
ncbi:hypothetical protein CR203_04630 [Salipaludibacillus neizhouensis]|uniref:DUF6884 domain-containing protein n=1 Tax=Salipaludibacillus neizhouensis TaxID=885475 RepID=A0A3A9K9Y6_9BACI|nr:DUF6884 domain-containing protein [Salipaludibacillus neizhouensis]RKL69317.1 hypothetical protein CR203_04630 [Salipaludibacillus neizhouensis]